MIKIAYIEKRFAAKTQKLIDLANSIINEYAAQGFDLTLRQLYYQLVARDYIPNQQKEYKKLVKTITDARMAGLIDWTAIVDRTRGLSKNSHWDEPQSILESCEYSFELDKWEGQPYRPEVWIEKDALRGVISDVCKELDVPHFSCRGYNSQSEMWQAAQRMIIHTLAGQTPYIIHLGDHDPSGIDMTRDITNRLETFGVGLNGHGLYVERIALNYDQVEQYNPPANPAKLTDSRIEGYITRHGYNSWELDALEPRVINDLVRDKIKDIRDDDEWEKRRDQELAYVSELRSLRINYGEVQEFLRGE